ALQLEGLNRHSSVHAAGVVIGDKPLEQICPIYFDGESEMPVVQYTLKYVEQVGLVKFDFLGLKTLTIIKDAIDYIKKTKNIDVNIDDIDLNDPEIYKMLQVADSVAVFQIESSGMRGMLKQIKPDNIEEIIALISLFRPGPMDNIPSYIRRKHGHEPIEYPHEKVEYILKDTFGIIVYQEQVMDMAKILAGYTLGAADLLRRAMGKKIKEEMDKQREVFVNGCQKHSNISPMKANEIFDLLAKFAEYGFNKAHAASYAVIGIQTAYLKRYYPVEFMTANLNIEVHNTDTINFYLEDIKKHNIKILPPDINISEDYFTIEKIDNGELAIRYSLSAIKGVGIDMIADIMRAREDKKFENIFDFCERVGTKIVNKKTMEALAKSGSFDSIHKNRKQIFDSTEALTVFTKSEEESKNNPQMDLFGGFSKENRIYPRLSPTDDWPIYDRLQKEFEAFGFYLQDHPLDMIRDKLCSKGVSFLEEITNNDSITDGVIVRLAGVVISTSIKSSDRGRYAFVSISDPTGLAELSLYDNNMITEHKNWLDDKEHKQLVVECSISRKENTEPRLIVREMWLLDDYLKLAKENTEKIRYIKKRDFNSFNFKNRDAEAVGDVDVVKEEAITKNERILNKLIIWTNSPQVIQCLQNVLLGCKKFDERFTEIRLIVNSKTIQLPNDYRINVPFYNDIKNIYGVEKVEGMF
ncbi:MAG: DNA polymerase III subunit alpha, partial [Rickettsiales bacterium]|nr:DNA polymerase III subunit alpha [Rickettsiales bacterium]